MSDVERRFGSGVFSTRRLIAYEKCGQYFDQDADWYAPGSRKKTKKNYEKSSLVEVSLGSEDVAMYLPPDRLPSLL